MSAEIIEKAPWPTSLPGQSVLDWEQAWFDAVVVDVFGYHSLQLGLVPLEGLRANRMPRRWLAMPELSPARHANVAPDLWACPGALPFGPASLDLLLMPHTLETCHDPHAALREAARVLVPEGRLVITGFRPVRWWGRGWQSRWLAHTMGLESSAASAWKGIGLWRLRDWLHLLDFEIELVEYASFRPMALRMLAPPRGEWLEALGARCCPFLGASYGVVAVKRVHGTRLLSAAWRQSSRSAVQGVPVTHRLPPRP